MLQAALMLPQVVVWSCSVARARAARVALCRCALPMQVRQVLAVARHCVLVHRVQVILANCLCVAAMHREARAAVYLCALAIVWMLQVRARCRLRLVVRWASPAQVVQWTCVLAMLHEAVR